MLRISDRLYAGGSRAELEHRRRRSAQRPARGLVFARRGIRQRLVLGDLPCGHARKLQDDTPHHFQSRRRHRDRAESRANARYPERAQRSLLRDALKRSGESLRAAADVYFRRQGSAVSWGRWSKNVPYLLALVVNELMLGV